MELLMIQFSGNWKTFLEKQLKARWVYCWPSLTGFLVLACKHVLVNLFFLGPIALSDL